MDSFEVYLNESMCRKSGLLGLEQVNSRFLLRFQDGCEKYLTSNKLTDVAVNRGPVTKKSKVPKISKKPDEAVYLEKGYYHGVYVTRVY